MIINTKFMGLSKDLGTGHLIATFELPNNIDIDKLKPLLGEDVDLRVEKHKPVRSKNANAYFHLLVAKLADALNISKAHAKNMMITRYGQPMVDEETGKRILWKTALSPEMVRELETPHAIATSYEGSFTIYTIYKGCHEYNTKEMATLIEGTKSELEEIGIHVDD